MQEEKLEDAHKFKLWKNHLVASGLEIHEIKEVFTRRRYNGEVLFSLLMLDATQPEGDKIPPICFLKGEVVCVLVCLIDKATREKHLLLVKQRRIAEGGFTYEHPAGMVDANKTPLEIAVQEVWEETGIAIEPGQLMNLSPQKRLFPSTGTSDEAMYFFAVELDLKKEEIMALHNQEQGADYEFERITIHVSPFPEAHQLITNTNGLLQNFLYLKACGDVSLMNKL